ncbi:MAG: hydroxymethylglutaryl-CoA synthase [Lactobacillus sp.]|nr:hydroxymethylglutaryl-CoA synthase [Lactobacillus sp.]
MKIGIDKIGFYTSHLYVDMAKLAKKRNEDPNKYLIGIGQEKMAVIPPTQDAVTLAANAADTILTEEDKEKIDLVLVATESGVDNSKSSAAYVSELLGLKHNIRTLELKQACYAATAGIQLAKGHINLNPHKKALVIGTDIARYGLKTPGEPTQGGGAVAMVISADPAVLALEDASSYYAKDIMDFWRPLSQTEAMVDGKYSANVYLEFFEQVFRDFQEQTGLTLRDFTALLFHLPYTKQGLKALRLAVENIDPTQATKYFNEFEASRKYNKLTGNLYTGSLYLSLLSLLENSDNLQAGDRLGLFSYGSGAQGEFFSGILQENYRQHLTNKTTSLLNKRQEVSVAEYEKLFNSVLTNEKNRTLDTTSDPATYVLTGIKDFKRQYQKK